KSEEITEKAHQCLHISLRLLVNLTANHPESIECNPDAPSNSCCKRVSFEFKSDFIKNLLRVLIQGTYQSSETEKSATPNSVKTISSSLDCKIMAVGVLINLTEKCKSSKDWFLRQEISIQCSEICNNGCQCNEKMSSTDALLHVYKEMNRADDEAHDSKLLAAYISILIGLLFLHAPEIFKKLEVNPGTITGMTKLLKEFITFQKMLISIENGEEWTENSISATPNSQSVTNSDTDSWSTPAARLALGGWKSASSSVRTKDKEAQMELLREIAEKEIGKCGAVGEAAVAMALASIERQFDKEFGGIQTPKTKKSPAREERRIRCVVEILEALKAVDRK
ncbi:hypothetical protein HK096_000733, partial [Nowakowskiella sp. JEL0078]